ncbi:MAG: VOC family protein [Cyanobacteria bacterium SBLK]|nr:VOC family protein [Cyanobacteria bacterium SBLK]
MLDMMKIVPRTFLSLLIALVVSVTLLLSNPQTATAAPYSSWCDTSDEAPSRRETGWVQRINVQDLEAALEYYQYGLHLTCNPDFFNPPFWAEVYFDWDPSSSIGLSANPDKPFEPENVITQIVPDLSHACINLKNQGIPIEESRYAGSGVCLAFFSDFSGNKLAYRQEAFFVHPDFIPVEEQCNLILKNTCSPGLEWNFEF